MTMETMNTHSHIGSSHFDHSCSADNKQADTTGLHLTLVPWRRMVWRLGWAL